MDQSLTSNSQQQKAFRSALWDTSTHWGDDAFFCLHYGANPFSATLSTAIVVMHANESCIFKMLHNVFVSSMPLLVQVDVKKLVEKLFVCNRQSARSIFSCMNFSGGACSLTMLSSHHGPGMVMAFLMVLLTLEGRVACQKCFQEDDSPNPDYDWDQVPVLDESPNPDYDWDQVPSVDPEYIYCHPILQSKCCRTHQVLVITMKSKGNNNKPVLKVVTTKKLQPPKRYHFADVCLPAITRPHHNSFGPRKLFVYP
jgi:hypothetical protein